MAVTEARLCLMKTPSSSGGVILLRAWSVWLRDHATDCAEADRASAVKAFADFLDLAVR